MNPADFLLLGVAALAVALYLWSPALPLIVALPASFWVQRLGGVGHQSNLSYSDFMLFVGTLFALPMLRWKGARYLKRVVVLAVVYQTATLFSVFAHPNRYDSVEWFHQLLLVVGAMIIGYVLVERRSARVALICLMVVACFFGLWTTGLFLLHGLHGVATLPGGLQKNLLGDLFAVTFLTAQFNPPWIGLRGRWVNVGKYICVAGIIGAQCRSAMVGLVFTIIFVAFREFKVGERAKLFVAALIPLGLVAYVTINGELASGSSTSSFAVRTSAYHESFALWAQYPLFGVGERFWYFNIYPVKIQPPNAEVSMLTTGGLVGLIGFLVLLLGTLWLLWHLPPVVGTMAFTVLLEHFVAGQFDIFWATSSGSLPWIIVGMGLAGASLYDRKRRAGELEELDIERPFGGFGTRGRVAVD